MCICVCVCVYTHCFLFIHSSVHENLGCFLVLTIVNNADTNIAVCVSFWVSVFLFFRIYTQWWNFGVQFLVVWETSILCFAVSVLMYISTNSVLLFPFLHMLFNNCCVPFDESHPDRCEVVSHCGLDLHFPFPDT